MNKPITKKFKKSSIQWYGTSPVWLSALPSSGGTAPYLAICDDALQKLWDLPTDTKTIYVTASAKRPAKGTFYELRRRDDDWFDTRWGMFGITAQFLTRNFGCRVYITVKY